MSAFSWAEVSVSPYSSFWTVLVCLKNGRFFARASSKVISSVDLVEWVEEFVPLPEGGGVTSLSADGNTVLAVLNSGAAYSVLSDGEWGAFEYLARDRIALVNGVIFQWNYESDSLHIDTSLSGAFVERTLPLTALASIEAVHFHLGRWYVLSEDGVFASDDLVTFAREADGPTQYFSLHADDGADRIVFAAGIYFDTSTTTWGVLSGTLPAGVSALFFHDGAFYCVGYEEVEIAGDFYLNPQLSKLVGNSWMAESVTGDALSIYDSGGDVGLATFTPNSGDDAVIWWKNGKHMRYEGGGWVGYSSGLPFTLLAANGYGTYLAAAGEIGVYSAGSGFPSPDSSALVDDMVEALAPFQAGFVLDAGAFSSTSAGLEFALNMGYAAYSQDTVTAEVQLLGGALLSAALGAQAVATTPAGAVLLLSVSSVSDVQADDELSVQAVLIALAHSTVGAAQAVPREDDNPTAWVVNATTGGSTRYENYPFNSFAKINGAYYGCRSDGIYRLDGEDDSGIPVQAMVSFGKQDFGTSALKRISNAYVGMSSSGRLFMKVIVEGEEYTYAARDSDEAIKQQRFDLGRGLRANYLEFELYNSGGDDFELASVEFLVAPLTRRI